MSTTEVESARRDWERGHDAFLEEARERGRAERLHALLETITDELRRRVGSTFTLEELAREYRRAETWARHTVSDHAAVPGWPRSLSTAVDAAFHRYARGAVDYEP